MENFISYFSSNEAFEPSFLALMIITSFDIVFLFFRFGKSHIDILKFICHIVVTYIVVNLFNALFRAFGGETGKLFFSIFLTMLIYVVFFGNYGIKSRIAYFCVLYSTEMCLIIFAGTFRALFGNGIYGSVIEIVLRNVIVAATVFVPLLLKKFNFDKLPMSGNNSFFLILMYNVFTVSISLIAHLFRDYFSFEGTIFSAVVSVGFICANLLAYYIVFKMEKSNALNLELTADKLMTEKNKDAMHIIERNLDDMRKIRHDMKNQFAYMRLMLDEKQYGSLEKYFKEMEESADSPLRYIDCVNKNIGTVLNLELAKTDARGYVLDTRLIISPELPFSDIDLCRLLTNLIDNAVEACDRYAISGAVIEVGIVQRNSYLYISVTNPIGEKESDGRIVNENELLSLESSKQDGLVHGYGTKIIDGIVQKYNGRINRSISEHKFISDIMLDMLWQSDGDLSHASERK